MKQENAIYIKISHELKEHVKKYVNKEGVRDGVSGLVRDLLIKKTKFTEKQ